MWARLLSSTNQPSFLDVKGDHEEKKEEESLHQVADEQISKVTSGNHNNEISHVYPAAC